MKPFNDRNILISLIVLALAAAAAQGIAQTAKSSSDLSKAATYAWQENSIATRQEPEVNARMEAAFRVAINRELQKKGYLLDPQKPDFFIHFMAGPKMDFEVSANTDFRLPVGTTVYTSQRPDGLGVTAWPVTISRTFVIATDTSSNAPLWEGNATKKYKDTDKAVKNMEREISQIVSQALKTFPSRKK